MKTSIDVEIGVMRSVPKSRPSAGATHAATPVTITAKKSAPTRTPPSREDYARSVAPVTKAIGVTPIAIATPTSVPSFAVPIVAPPAQNGGGTTVFAPPAYVAPPTAPPAAIEIVAPSPVSTMPLQPGPMPAGGSGGGTGSSAFETQADPNDSITITPVAAGEPPPKGAAGVIIGVGGGAAVGFFAGGPVGAVVGAALGYFFGR